MYLHLYGNVNTYFANERRPILLVRVHLVDLTNNRVHNYEMVAQNENYLLFYLSIQLNRKINDERNACRITSLNCICIGCLCPSSIKKEKGMRPKMPINNFDFGYVRVSSSSSSHFISNVIILKWNLFLQNITIFANK